jgi:hypothetical protein
MSTQLKKKWRSADTRPRNIADLHKEFHDRATWRFREYLTPDGTPRDLAMLGKLVELNMEDGQVVRFEDNPAVLGASGGKKRRRLHIGLTVPYDMPEGTEAGCEYNHGEVLTVVYEARKPHLDTGRLNEYEHQFCDEGWGELPQLIFIDGLMRFRFGSYYITLYGIQN